MNCFILKRNYYFKKEFPYSEKRNFKGIRILKRILIMKKFTNIFKMVTKLIAIITAAPDDNISNMHSLHS